MQNNKNSDYFSSFGEPVHRQSYCAFLDVLGFSDKIRASYKDDNSANTLLKDFHQILTKRLAWFKRRSGESMLYFKSFSDNVLLAWPQSSDDMEAEFVYIMWSINNYQFQMALKGFFIRGGLAADLLFVDENCVYGMALLEAYHLESEVAVNPVVVLCDKSMKLVDEHIRFYVGEPAPQLNHVLKGPDGRYFLNYLTECIDDDDGEQSLDTESLRQHKIQIESALKTYAEKPKVFSKYVWLAAYHNYFCDMVSRYPGYEDSLKVAATLAITHFQRLTQNSRGSLWSLHG